MGDSCNSRKGKYIYHSEARLAWIVYLIALHPFRKNLEETVKDYGIMCGPFKELRLSNQFQLDTK